jgi:hypothetical protein
MDPIQSIVGVDEVLPVTHHRESAVILLFTRALSHIPLSVYPTIDPNEAFANQTYHGKVVFITGASRGIGQETAITYAKAGANVTIVGRLQETLDKAAAAILAAVSGAHVLAVPADVRDPKAIEAAVQATLERFGRLDILIANAGAFSNVNQSTCVSTEKLTCLADTTPNAGLGDKDPERWWNTFEVNVRGVYNAVRYGPFSLSRQDLDGQKAPRYRPSRKPAGVSWSFHLPLRNCVTYMQATTLLQSTLSTAWLNSSPLVRRHAQPYLPVSASNTLIRIPHVDSIFVAPGFSQDPDVRRRERWFPR